MTSARSKSKPAEKPIRRSQRIKDIGARKAQLALTSAIAADDREEDMGAHVEETKKTPREKERQRAPAKKPIGVVKSLRSKREIPSKLRVSTDKPGEGNEYTGADTMESTDKAVATLSRLELLPDELLDRVCGNLHGTGDIYHLAKVSRRFPNIALDHLYKGKLRLTNLRSFSTKDRPRAAHLLTCLLRRPQLAQKITSIQLSVTKSGCTSLPQSLKPLLKGVAFEKGVLIPMSTTLFDRIFDWKTPTMILEALLVVLPQLRELEIEVSADIYGTLFRYVSFNQSLEILRHISPLQKLTLQAKNDDAILLRNHAFILANVPTLTELVIRGNPYSRSFHRPAILWRFPLHQRQLLSRYPTIKSLCLQIKYLVEEDLNAFHVHFPNLEKIRIDMDVGTYETLNPFDFRGQAALHGSGYCGPRTIWRRLRIAPMAATLRDIAIVDRPWRSSKGKQIRDPLTLQEVQAGLWSFRNVERMEASSFLWMRNVGATTKAEV